MTFLNPLVLFGLAAAAIPVLIHLLSRRKLRTIDFSSLRFLKELQQTSIKRLRIRQMLLLILRVLLIVSVVLAFARPVLRGSVAGILGNEGASSVIILLDDSPSMGVRNERGEIFARARDAAAEILALCRENDRVILSTLSATALGDTLGPPGTPAAALATLRSLTVAKTSVPLSTALKKARRTLSIASTANREIYVLTDVQATQCALPETPGDSLAPGPDSPALFLLTSARGPVENAGIHRAEILSSILASGRPVSLQAEVQNGGDRPLQESVVSVYLDGARVAQHTVTLAPRSTSVLSVSVVPKRRGILPGYFLLEDDALDADNRANFVLAIPPRIRVALAGPSPAETHYAALALTLAGDSSLAGVITAERIDEEKLPASDLESYDALILCGIRDFTPALAERLAAFVSNGKGLVFFPGSATNVASYNRNLAPRLGLPLFSSRDAGASPPAGRTTASFLSFAKVDYAHPIFAGLFETETAPRDAATRIASPEIRRTAGINGAGGGTVVIELGNGEPFLTELRPGNGRFLLFTVDALPDWSDFPLKGIFAPLLHRSLLYVASGGRAERSFTAGEPLRLTVRRSSVSGQNPAVVVAPSGLEERVAPRFRTSTGTLSYETSPASETGIYTLRGADRIGSKDVLDAAAVDVAPSETDLHPAGQELLERLWRRLGFADERVRTLGPTDDLERTVRESRYGVELWKFFAGLAFVIAVAESLLARNWGRQEKAAEGELS
ncbi:MAG: hypothetical protein C3F17_13450 [Bradyrhizobiaceae bacterium]|nr:MAG: hypothetical protein C3F17_13450 [Bradyrhizobiaceae bacterium]